MERTYIEEVPEHAQEGVVAAWPEEHVGEGAAHESTALAVVPRPRPRSALATLSHAGAVAWRQPAVRAAVRAGASAMALSVALRIATRLLASRSARQAATEAALPSLMQLLEPGEQRTMPRGHGVEVTETVIYMRRITRR
jgi:hypothetical protein